jgi:hypothetical protein
MSKPLTPIKLAELSIPLSRFTKYSSSPLDTGPPLSIPKRSVFAPPTVISINLSPLNPFLKSGFSLTDGPSNLICEKSSAKPALTLHSAIPIALGVVATKSGTLLDISNILYLQGPIEGLSLSCCFLSIRYVSSSTLFLSDDGKLSQTLPSSAG